MARPGLFSHRKFRRLARTLNDEALAVGTLECLWFAAAETCDPRIGDDRDVEIAARWKGAPGVLVPALVAAGFLDRDAESYVVHNFWDHAPEYVLKRAAREAQRRGGPNGAAPAEVSDRLSRRLSGHFTSRSTGQTAAVGPDARMLAVHSRTEQNRKEKTRAGEPRAVSASPKKAKPKHQPKTDGAWSCPHSPQCPSYDACIKRTLDDANARS